IDALGRSDGGRDSKIFLQRQLAVVIGIELVERRRQVANDLRPGILDVARLLGDQLLLRHEAIMVGVGASEMPVDGFQIVSARDRLQLGRSRDAERNGGAGKNLETGHGRSPGCSTASLGYCRRAASDK